MPARHASRETRPFCSSRREDEQDQATATASVQTIMWLSRSRWRCCTPRHWRFCGGRGALNAGEYADSGVPCHLTRNGGLSPADGRRIDLPPPKEFALLRALMERKTAC